MDKEILINDFAIRSFRDVADYDYIAARMAYRARLVPQFLWSSLQALEKYLKCILLLNRIKSNEPTHSLKVLLDLLKTHDRFELRLRQPSRDFIKHLDTYGRFRYLETPFYLNGLEIMKLDMVVWDIRRYCRVLDYEVNLLNGEKKQMLDIELQAIKHCETKSPQFFSITGGALEKIVKNKEHPAREPLLWQNGHFGVRARKTVRLSRYSHATNSPLSMHPEILEDVREYIFLPKEVVTEYREELKRRTKIARKT